MELATDNAISLCIEAHQRLLQQISGFQDAQARQPSLLPEWTVGHVLTHLARNADGHVSRLIGALRGEEIARYPGGSAERDAAIEVGSGRSAQELIADVAGSNTRLEKVWRQSAEANWPNAHLMAGDAWPTFASPLRRLREVEIHHMDLGLGYQAAQWSEEYVEWELRQALAGLPKRLDGEQSRQLLLWLVGRREMPEIRLGAWL